jgi:hypothetical protein
MTTQTRWTRYDQPRLLTGNLYSGIGIEIDRRDHALRSETDRRCQLAIASTRRIRGLRDLRHRVGHRLVHIGTAIQGVDAHQAHTELVR